MPFSSESGKPLVDRAVKRIINFLHSYDYLTGDKLIKPASSSLTILDVGVGAGTYSTRYSSSLLARPAHKWVGVEIWEPYITKYELLKKYDQVHTKSIQSFFDDEPDQPSFDICFMGDVIEHLPRDEVIKTLNASVEKNKFTIISIPIGHYPQDEYDNNPYERHETDNWSIEEALSMFPAVLFWGQEKEIGVFILGKKHSHLFDPKIGVYGICKNEEEFIQRCLSSVSQADAISFCDTGSTDNTVEILKTSPAIITQAYISPWRFDDAHNIALLSLPEELDACVSIDADEFLAADWYQLVTAAVKKDLQVKGRVSDRYNHRFKTVWDWRAAGTTVSEHWHERIHARHGMTWKLPVHEHLVKSTGEPEDIGWITDLLMIQHPDTGKSRASYLPLLELSVTEDPKRWKSWSFLAGEYQNAGDTKKAIDAINKGKALLDSDKAFLSYQAAMIYKSTNDYDNAISENLLSIRCSPNIREYRFHLAETHEQAGNIIDAFHSIKAAARITQRTYGYEYNPWCWSPAFDTKIEELKQRAHQSETQE